MKRQAVASKPVAARFLCFEQAEEKNHMFGDLLRFLFLGPIGGAKAMDRRSAAEKGMATFLVAYEDGQRGPETVEVDTHRYFQLMELTDRWESFE